MRRNFAFVFSVFVISAFLYGVYLVNEDSTVKMVDPEELIRDDAARNNPAPSSGDKNKPAGPASSIVKKGDAHRGSGEFSAETLRKHTPVPKPSSFKDTKEMPLDTTPIYPPDYTVSDEAFLAKVKEFSAPLEKNAADKIALERMILFLCRVGRPNEAVPYFDRFVAAGGELKSLGDIIVADVPASRGKSPMELIGSGLEFYIKGLAMVGRFNDANAKLIDLENSVRGFSECGLTGITLRFYELYDKAKLRKDALETTYAMERLNSRWPIGEYQNTEATANLLIVEMLEEVASSEDFLNQFKRLDQLWGHIPANTMAMLSQSYLEKGMPMSPLLLAAADPLMKGEFCNPAAMIRRSKLSLTRGEDPALALRQAKQAVTLAKGTGNKELELFAAWNLADVAHAVGDLEAEVQAVADGEEIAKESGMDGFKLNSSLRAAALCESLSDDRRAVELYQTIIRRARELNVPATAHQALNAFHRFAARNVVPADIEPELKKQVDDLAKINAAQSLQADANLNLAICQAREKKTDDAAKALAQVLKGSAALQMMEAYVEVGQLCLNEKNGAEAEKAYSQGLKLEETSRDPSLRWRLKLGHARAKELQKDIPGARQILNEAMTELETAGGSTTQFHARRKGLESAQDVYIYALELALQANDGTSAFLIGERARALSVADAANGSKKLAPAAGKFEDVKAASAGRKTVLYLMGNGVVYAWVVSGDAIVLERITATRRELQREISALQKSYASAGSGDAWQAASKKVYERLWLPVAKHIKAGERVAIVPHGIINYVPFHALNDGTAFLVEQHEFSYAPTGGVLAELSKRPVAAPGNAILFDPVFSMQANAPGRFTETAAIKEMLPNVSTVSSTVATDARLQAEATNAGLLHVCAFGRYDPWVPLKSGFELWRNNTPTLFTLAEISNLNLKRCELAVCNLSMSAQNELSAGDEINAAARAFQAAGARNVITGTWKMELLPAFPVMRTFYSNLKASLADPVKALALSQRALLKENAHPATWAAYRINGAGK